MHIHILGICGTFMGGLALMARELGHHVTGSDENIYPPMSTQLTEAGIKLTTGYRHDALSPTPDLMIIGNALSRGNPAVEHVLNQNMPYISGAEWLAKEVLHTRWVIAVAGTHGKTTTSSLVAWILEYAGLSPGFLIGGVPANFGQSARLGASPFFVIEADEYDTAFFDKRAKFVHYRPRTAILNNLEYDHADIYPNLAAIETQFHHLIRTIPGNGKIIAPTSDEALKRVLARGCWSEVESLFSADGWTINPLDTRGQHFEIQHRAQAVGVIHWSLMGAHNQANALAAVVAARHCGVKVEVACEALNAFKGIKRRMELKGVVNRMSVYDDFAHHPTAIETTIAGLRAVVGNDRIIAIVDPRSATMKMGVHKDSLLNSLTGADLVYVHKPANLSWEITAHANVNLEWAPFANVDDIVANVKQQARPNDHILIMSNGGFDGIHDKILAALA